MRNTRTKHIENARYIDTVELCDYLSCGTNTARKIGKEAGAFIKLGRRTVFDIRAVDAYIEKLKQA